MRRFSLAASCVALLTVLAATIGVRAQGTSAERMYVDAGAKETATRKALTPGAPVTVLRAVRTVIADYEALVKRFPSSGYCDDALWRAAEISRDAFDQFGDETEKATAIRLLQSLGTRYPASKWNKEAPAVLNTLRTAAPVTNRTEVAPVAEPSAPPSTGGPVATITDIRRASLQDAVRIVVQLDREVSFHDERLDNPARIFLDLPLTRTTTALQDQTIRFDGDSDLIRQVRLGRHPNTTTRVVLEAAGVSSYSVYQLYNPFRLVIDCLREQAGPDAIASVTLKAPPPAPIVSPPRNAPAPVMPMVAPAVVAAARPPAAPVTPVTGTKPPPPVPLPMPVPALRARRLALSAPVLPVSIAMATAALREAMLPDPPLPATPTLAVSSRITVPVPASTAVSSIAEAVPAAAALIPAIPAESAARVNPPSLPQALPREPSHNLDGGFSIARQLGLGVSRIVIDPGHGGRDPGTKGAGTTEAAVVLDIALRLEKLLTRLPGVVVVLTRRTDDYVSLQERTAIANRENADLFLSIHVNAHQSKEARGVETYFLNFASNLSAASVAARENAASGQLMGELPDVVKTIALNNKLDESRDFATYVQREMMAKLRSSNKEIKDLGVKQAPFVVLIGAAMPSALAEVAFMTNPQESRLIKGNSYRQAIAEALFEGLKRYQTSLKNLPSVATQ